jgi:hypothetical protein
MHAEVGQDRRKAEVHHRRTATKVDQHRDQRRANPSDGEQPVTPRARRWRPTLLRLVRHRVELLAT